MHDINVEVCSGLRLFGILAAPLLVPVFFVTADYTSLFSMAPFVRGNIFIEKGRFVGHMIVFSRRRGKRRTEVLL